MTCKLKPELLYDLELLGLGKLPLDTLARSVSSHKALGLRSESRIWKGMYDVTPELVDAYASEGKDHLKQIRDSLSVYGYLYFVADHSREWYTAPHFDYAHFPLMKSRDCVLSRIRKMAEEQTRPNTNKFDATCLYLLYFFALMANPSLNWITIDYLANGNRYHQYGTRLKGRMKIVTKRVWV